MDPQQISRYQRHPHHPLPLDNNNVSPPSAPTLIDYRIKQNKFLGARFIFECGTKLSAGPTTIATAATLFHRFFKEVNKENGYDVYLIASSCLLMASKAEGQHQFKLRDVVNVAYSTIHRNALPLDLNDQYWGYRDAIVQAELLILRVVKFQSSIREHGPHKFLLHYLKTLEQWIGYDNWIGGSKSPPVARTAWAFLQDFHHDPTIIEYPPQAVAVAALKLAIDVYGVEVPLCSSTSRKKGHCWEMIFYPDFDSEVHDKITGNMLDIYTQEGQELATLAYKSVNGNGK